MDLSAILSQPEYNFLRTDEHLGKHIILLGLAGSYSYGTNNENSDFDIRGVALDSYIVSNLERFKQLTDSMEDDRKKEWTELNELFVQMVSHCGE